MAIHTDNAVQGQQGFAKTLDEKSTSILLDLTQENQYQFPVQSTIRELVSNAVDSTTEKFNALDILGGAPISKYFVEKEGEVYHASGWKPEYFNPNYLSPSTTVRIEIEQRSLEHQRDLLRVIDEGVGLWGERLEGYFKISYSTKRLNANSLGKFGIGAKAPLSMDIASFRMITTYEGKRTAFDIFNRKIEPVYGKWNANEELRNSFVFSNGVQVYYDEVDAPNGVTIEVETKKVERQNLLNAIKSQLLFFSTVELWVKSEWQEEYQKKDFQANIIYEDDYLILSDNNQYSAPHLVLDNGNTKVCYGKIEFGQLELENKSGNIGLKIRAEDVDIVPSREYVKWGAKTRETVLDRFRQAQMVASNLVQEVLKETDPLRWLEKAATIVNNLGGTNSVLGRLSRIVDRSGITPTFPGVNIKFEGIDQMFYGVKMRNVEVVSRSNGYTTTRPDIHSWSQVNFGAFYYTKGSAHPTKDVQLYRKHGQAFTLLTLPEQPVEPIAHEVVGEAADAILAYSNAKGRYSLAMERINWLLESELALDYDAVEIDVVLEEQMKQEQKIALAQVDEEELTPAQKRKLEGKVFMKCISSLHNSSTYCTIEPTLKEVQEWDMPIVYGAQEDKEELFFLGQMLHSGSKYNVTVYHGDFKIIQASQEVIKKLPKHAVPVKSFYFQTTPTSIALHPMLKPWYTCLQIEEYLKKVPFLENFGVFHQEMADLYKELQQYLSKHKPHTNYASYQPAGKLYQELLEACNKMAIFEQYSKDHSTDTEAIAEKSQELFGINSVTGSSVWDTDMQMKLEKLQLYCAPLIPLFNEFSCLTSNYKTITPEVEAGIKDLMSHLNVQTQ